MKFLSSQIHSNPGRFLFLFEVSAAWFLMIVVMFSVAAAELFSVFLCHYKAVAFF